MNLSLFWLNIDFHGGEWLQLNTQVHLNIYSNMSKFSEGAKLKNILNLKRIEPLACKHLSFNILYESIETSPFSTILCWQVIVYSKWRNDVTTKTIFDNFRFFKIIIARETKQKVDRIEFKILCIICVFKYCFRLIFVNWYANWNWKSIESNDSIL